MQWQFQDRRNWSFAYAKQVLKQVASYSTYKIDLYWL